MSRLEVDICVIGAGSGGLSVAAGAVQMGASVALVEADKMGGDCLNYGCVPSKALIAAAKRAQMMRDVGAFGIQSVDPEIHYSKVRDHVQGVISTIAPHDSVERFVSLGVKVVQAPGKFISRNEIIAGDVTIQAKRFVIAAGSSPNVFPIPGLDQVNYFTNETIFDLTKKPAHLIVIGGGPIGIEMAQAHLMLGAKVTVLEKFTIMPNDDPELVDIVRHNLLQQKLNLYEGVDVLKIEKNNQDIGVIIKNKEQQETIVGSHLLVATGRKPNIEHLDLEKAGIEYHQRGITVDQRLRTTNKKIFAIGDVASPYQFTHVAGYHAGIVIRNALFRLPAKVNYSAVPWVTYTHPELAHVGLTEKMAQAKNIHYKILKFPFSDIDRSQAEHEVEGFIKVLVNRKGIILGASIVGAKAGELIVPWILAISRRLKISAMAGMIIPYPTRSDIHKRVAGEFYTPMLYSKRMRRIVRWFNYLP